MASFLITGGAGFVGSHLATALVEQGHRVRVIDNLRSGSWQNLFHLRSRIERIEGSILDDSLMLSVARGVDVIFHTAAMVSVPQSVAEPYTCHEICATGTLKVLLAAQKCGVKRVVYSASSSCYGDRGVCPITEDNPLAPKSPYAAAKLAGEHYCEAFQATSPVETVRLRYFNVFGPRQDPSSPYSGVISIFCKYLLAGKTPTIYGDGLQTRDFVNVRDVVQANLLAAEVPEASGQVFNIGTGQSQTLLELLKAINSVLGTEIRPEFAEARSADVRFSQADISKAKSVLGFQPSVALTTGLADCLEYYRELAGKTS